MQRVFRYLRYWYFLPAFTVCLILLSLLPSCRKDEDVTRAASTRDKMLGTWRRNLRAYDNNRNGIVESSERISSAVDTIILTLVPDATYTRIQRFKGADYPETGTWHLSSDDEQIVLQPSTSTSRVDTCILDTVSEAFFMMHTAADNYYQGFVRPN